MSINYLQMKVSVIIPCYNGEEYIGQTLGSLLDQTRPVDEIIVVDDESDDRSMDIARSFSESVTVLPKKNGGAAKARNYGADYAVGDALMFLDADDVLAPDVIEHLLAQLEINPDGVVACPWYRLDKIGDKWVKHPPSCKPLGKEQDYLSGWITGWYHLPCSILWSRTAYEKTGGWDPRAYVNDDGDLMMRALSDGIELQITDKGASFYRRMPEEKQSDSLSGARFTREGREAQIYVMRKIAQRLEDRGRLDEYRLSITRALERFQSLCKTHYPDLSNECSELINRYGEPFYVRIVRKLINAGRQVRNDIRRFLSRIKNKLVSQYRSNDVKSNRNEIEIRYGINTYHKVLNQAGKGQIVVPSSPDISIIIPIYNEDVSVYRNLENVLNQSYENIEIIIVFNRSLYDLEKNHLQVEDPRVRFVIDENLQNVSSFYNRGLMKLKGEFIAFLYPGDEWITEKLSLQMEKFQLAHNGVGLIYSGEETEDEHRNSSKDNFKTSGNIYKELLSHNVIGSCSSVMIRRTVIPSVGFFDNALSERAEHDYWLRISRYFEFGIIDKPIIKNHSPHNPKKNDFVEDVTNNKSDAQSAFIKKHLPAMKRV